MIYDLLDIEKKLAKYFSIDGLLSFIIYLNKDGLLYTELLFEDKISFSCLTYKVEKLKILKNLDNRFEQIETLYPNAYRQVFLLKDILEIYLNKNLICKYKDSDLVEIKYI